MKAVLISINPIWCEEIASGKKTVEIRKTKPKLDAPFRCFIYETNGITDTPWVDEDGHLIFKGRGAVIGEFVCDWIGDGIFTARGSGFSSFPIYDGTCLNLDNYMAYVGAGKKFFGWHISNIKMYDKPKPLSDFKRWNRTEENDPCAHVPSLYPRCKDCKECNLKRPP